LAKQRRQAIHAQLYEKVAERLRPVLPELQGYAASRQAGESENEDDDDFDDDDTRELGQVCLGRELSMGTIKAYVSSQHVEWDSAAFESIPNGWVREFKDTGRRRPQVLFVRTTVTNRTQAGVCNTRAELEIESEKDHLKSSKRPWLGNVFGGRWEVRKQHVGPAMQHIIELLIKHGCAEQVETEKGVQYIVANTYVLGKPFAKAGAKANVSENNAEEVEASPVEVSEYEADRQANMARNAAFLASLGL